jgi:hypothetical protein
MSEEPDLTFEQIKQAAKHITLAKVAIGEARTLLIKIPTEKILPMMGNEELFKFMADDISGIGKDLGFLMSFVSVGFWKAVVPEKDKQPGVEKIE